MSRGVGTQPVELGDLVRSAWQRTDRQVAYRRDPQTLVQPRPISGNVTR